MGKKRNRRKRNMYRSGEVPDYVTFLPGSGKPPENETKSARHDKAWESTLVEKSTTVSSTKCELAQDVGNSDQKKAVPKDSVNETAKPNYSSSASEARREGKFGPAIRSLNCGSSSLEKRQQDKASAVKDIGNLREVEKDDLQKFLKSSDSHEETFVPFDRNGHRKMNNDKQSNYAVLGNGKHTKTESNSPVQSQTESINYYRCGGNSLTSCTSIKSCSSKVGAIAKTGGTISREVSQAGSVTGRSDTANAKPLRTTQTVTKYTGPVQFKSGNRFSSNSSRYDVTGSLDDRCVYSHEFNKSYGETDVPPDSGNKISCGHSNSMFSSAATGSPAGNPNNRFKVALNQWLKIRNESIRKLQKLLDNALSNEAFYDNVELNCKYGSAFCKEGKISSPTMATDFISSLGSMFCDMASGLTSVAHMFSTNDIQFQFQQVMETDANASKEMYEERSRYITDYRYTDEIIRKFGGTTLGETLGKISDAVGITEFFQEIKKANDNREDIVMAAVSALDIIINKNSNRDVGREVVDAVQDLVESNPACVGTVAGVGRSLYGAADLRMVPVKGAGKVGAVVKAGTAAVDLVLLAQDRDYIRELERKISRGSQSTVGKHIQEALDIFIQERREMMDLLYKL